MAGKKSYLAKLEEIAREYEVKLRPEEWVRSRLGWEDWGGLGKEAAIFAEQEIRRRRWRGSRNGVLPRGYDGEAIAWEAIQELLSGNCRLPVGFTRSKVEEELKRLVRQKIRGLHRLREARSTRNEWDLASNEAGEDQLSALQWVVSEAANAYQEAVAQEEAPERLKEKIEGFLDGEQELKEVFGCLWEGIRKPAEIARRLGKEEREIIRARKRLDRRLAEFGRRREA